MKYVVSISLLLLSLFATAQNNYQLKVNDSVLNISLDKNYSLNIGGQKINLILSELDTLSYSDEICSFKYLKEYRISKTSVGDGVTQISILTSEGSGFLVQTYPSLNPTKLAPIVMDEITKESLNYGFTKTESTYKKTLASGQAVSVTKNILKYNDEVNIYEIAATGKKDSGVIILTMKMSEINTQGDKILKLLWNSFKLK